MQTEAESLLFSTTCLITRPTYTVNSIGEGVAGWATVAGSAECRLIKPSFQVNLGTNAGAPMVDVDWYLILHHDQDIANADRITIAGKNYEVIKVNEEAGWRVFNRCTLKRMEE